MLMTGFGNKTPVIGFAVTLVALCVIAALSYRNIRQLADHDRWVAHTHEVLRRTRRITLRSKGRRTRPASLLDFRRQEVS